VHLEQFPDLPEAWRDDALAAQWRVLRDLRGAINAALEEGRRDKVFGSSLQAELDLALDAPRRSLLAEAEWADLAIVSQCRVVEAAPGAAVSVAVRLAAGNKCARCWRVLPEVGLSAAHPTLCLRCEDAVETACA
jgi:isoleucyl-tRNA synthetase